MSLPILLSYPLWRDYPAAPSWTSALQTGPTPTIAWVAYDGVLADRVRALLPADVAVAEQAMFGGLAFLVDGNMAIAASGQGGVLVRVDPADSEELMATTSAVPMEMRGRPMRGWLRLAADEVRTERQLATWVELGVRYAGSLPRKSRLTADQPGMSA